MKKYRVIVKADNEKFVKYNVNNLLLFTAFLDRSWPEWRWFNVYAHKGETEGSQLANFTNKNRPTSRSL
jgi:hypothetical protein